MKHILFLALILTLHFPLFSQTKSLNKKYVFPIKPNQTNSLSGSMGEIRSNHFHGGLDIRTESRTGLSVHATQSGYVYRIKVKPWGYGYALYLKHPDGNMSVYGHLSKYREDIAEYVKKNQYKIENFEVDLYPDEDLFPIQRGEEIAKSGNSGSSGGPHLHFEIRNAKDEVLNPLNFDFSEIKDAILPTVELISLEPMDENARIEGDFEAKEYKVYGTGRKLTISKKITAYGWLGLETLTYDRLNGASFKNGTIKVRVEINNELVYQNIIDEVSYDKTNYLNVFADYEYIKKKRKKVQRCYVADGNKLDFYNTNSTNGKFFIEDGKSYSVKMEFYDSYNNKSELNFTIEGKKSVQSKSKKTYSQGDYEIRDHYLIFYTDNTSLPCTNCSPIQLHFGWLRMPSKIAYQTATNNVHIWNLSKGVPDSVVLSTNKTIYPKIDMVIPSETDFVYFGKNVSIHFPDSALFDTLFLQTKIDKHLISINHKYIPLFKNIEIKFKPDSSIQNKEHARVYGTNSKGGKSYIVGGEWKEDAIVFETKKLGDFGIFEDSKKPIVKVLKRNSKGVQCSINDKESGISSFRATIDGEWLLMNYNPKKKLLTSETLDKNGSLKGEFVLEVRDGANNLTKVEFTIK